MKNITVKQYSQLADNSAYAALEHLEAKNYFAGKVMDINKMPWANVKYCFRLLPKIETWQGVQQLFEICYDVKEGAFYEAGIIEYFQARRYIIREFEAAAKREAATLASQSADDALWQMAGADKLRPYSDTLPLVGLSKAFGAWPFDIGRRPYGEVFSLLVQMKAQGEVENEFMKLKQK